MSRVARLLDAARGNPAAVRYSALLHLVHAVGYTLARQSGSHQIFTAPGLPLINLQREAGKAKPYQVRQVLAIIDAYHLKVE